MTFNLHPSDERRHLHESRGEWPHPSLTELLDALPRNAMGKVLKYELRGRFGGASIVKEGSR